MPVSKTLTKRVLMLTACISLALLHFALQNPTANNPASLTASSTTVRRQAKANIGLPMRLKIPKINLDAALDYVDITPQGELGVPIEPANAAWYDQGPRPGATGDAVIDGHFGYKDHIPAVFDNLDTLQKGDKLYVQDQNGVTIAFVVRELRTYGSDEYASAVFRSNDSQAHLNLITCEGTWSEAQKSFSNRLVVFTDKIT